MHVLVTIKLIAFAIAFCLIVGKIILHLFVKRSSTSAFFWFGKADIKHTVSKRERTIKKLSNTISLFLAFFSTTAAGIESFQLMVGH